jgi:hypothetical protein
MTTPPVGVERRVGQRFPFNLPVSLREVSTAVEGLGFTQDLSSRGVFLFTDMALSEGAEVELTLRMPSEITLGEDMRVRCRGQILRIVQGESQEAEKKIGVAVCLKGYEYLTEMEEKPSDFRRVDSLHHSVESEQSAGPIPLNPRVAH